MPTLLRALKHWHLDPTHTHCPMNIGCIASQHFGESSSSPSPPPPLARRSNLVLSSPRIDSLACLFVVVVVSGEDKTDLAVRYSRSNNSILEGWWIIIICLELNFEFDPNTRSLTHRNRFRLCLCHHRLTRLELVLYNCVLLLLFQFLLHLFWPEKHIFVLVPARWANIFL